MLNAKILTGIKPFTGAVALALPLIFMPGCGGSSSAPETPLSQKINGSGTATLQTTGNKPVENYSKVIGLSIAGSDACYDAASSVFEHYAGLENWKVLKKLSDYKKEKEAANIDEFIAKKVDAVAIVTTDIDTAGESAKKLNAANIPVFYFMTMPRFPEDTKATGIVTTDWYMTGYLNGEYIAKNQPGARCALIEGGYDQGMTELMRKGFTEGIGSIAEADAKVVTNISGSWMKPNAMVATEELLNAPDKFNCIFTGNEEMMAGVIDVLKARDRIGQYKLYSENGRRDISGKYIRNGVMTATADAATTQEGDIVFQMMKAYFAGKEIPYHVYSPVKLLTSNNIDDAVPWTLDDYLENKSQGKISIQLSQLNPVESPRGWSSEKNNYSNVFFHK